jgi:hypothetical protein
LVDYNTVQLDECVHDRQWANLRYNQWITKRTGEAYRTYIINRVRMRRSNYGNAYNQTSDIHRANGKYAKKEHIHRMKPARLKRGRLNLQTLVILQSVELRCNQVGAGKNA